MSCSDQLFTSLSANPANFSADDVRAMAASGMLNPRQASQLLYIKFIGPWSNSTPPPPPPPAATDQPLTDEPQTSPPRQPTPPPATRRRRLPGRKRKAPHRFGYASPSPPPVKRARKPRTVPAPVVHDTSSDDPEGDFEPDDDDDDASLSLSSDDDDDDAAFIDNSVRVVQPVVGPLSISQREMDADAMERVLQRTARTYGVPTTVLRTPFGNKPIVPWFAHRLSELRAVSENRSRPLVQRADQQARYLARKWLASPGSVFQLPRDAILASDVRLTIAVDVYLYINEPAAQARLACPSTIGSVLYTPYVNKVTRALAAMAPPRPVSRELFNRDADELYGHACLPVRMPYPTTAAPGLTRRQMTGTTQAFELAVLSTCAMYNVRPYDVFCANGVRVVSAFANAMIGANGNDTIHEAMALMCLAHRTDLPARAATGTRLLVFEERVRIAAHVYTHAWRVGVDTARPPNDDLLRLSDAEIYAYAKRVETLFSEAAPHHKLVFDPRRTDVLLKYPQ